jgi:hypothetical protein
MEADLSAQKGEPHATIPVESPFGSFYCWIHGWIVALQSTLKNAANTH